MSRFVSVFVVLLFGGSAAAQQPAELVPPQIPAAQGPVVQGPGVPEDMVVGEKMIVVFGPQRDRIWVYSFEQGNWNRQMVPKDGPVLPQITESVVYLQVGKRLFAYSAPRGSWSSIGIDAPVALPAQVGNDGVWVREGPKVHAFSAKAGGWSTIDVSRD